MSAKDCKESAPEALRTIHLGILVFAKVMRVEAGALVLDPAYHPDARVSAMAAAGRPVAAHHFREVMEFMREYCRRLGHIHTTPDEAERCILIVNSLTFLLQEGYTFPFDNGDLGQAATGEASA